MKARAVTAVVAKRLGVALPGLDEVLPRHPTLADVDSHEARIAYQAAKRAAKAAGRRVGSGAT